MGHTERNYAGENPAVNYEYKNEPPTLLAAGFLENQTINGVTDLPITMKPLKVDTVFIYGEVTAKATLPVTELPAGIGASVVWTLTGGFETLLDAQRKTGLLPVLDNKSDFAWPWLALKEQKTILRWTGGGRRPVRHPRPERGGLQPDYPGPGEAHGGDPRFGQLQTDLLSSGDRDPLDYPQRGERPAPG
jgi:hypothetical protein